MQCTCTLHMYGCVHTYRVTLRVLSWGTLQQEGLCCRRPQRGTGPGASGLPHQGVGRGVLRLPQRARLQEARHPVWGPQRGSPGHWYGRVLFLFSLMEGILMNSFSPCTAFTTLPSIEAQLCSAKPPAHKPTHSKLKSITYLRNRFL